MKTSLNEIITIEKHLDGSMSAEETHAFKDRLQVDASLSNNVSMQSLLLRIVRIYQRRKLKHQLEQVHIQLLKTDFKNSIHSIFNP